jgi:hypothetical protein
MAGKAPPPGAWRRLRIYVARDLREIVAPSSLPNPPGLPPPPPPLPLGAALRRAAGVARRYVETWDREKLDAALRERGLLDEEEPAGAGGVSASGAAVGETLRDLAARLGAAARGGSAAVRPVLQEAVRTRAAAYRDAVREFIAGYREGFREEEARGEAAEAAGGEGGEGPPPPPPPLA